jgi:hypothetical protein
MSVRLTRVVTGNDPDIGNHPVLALVSFLRHSMLEVKNFDPTGAGTAPFGLPVPTIKCIVPSSDWRTTFSNIIVLYTPIFIDI